MMKIEKAEELDEGSNVLIDGYILLDNNDQEIEAEESADDHNSIKEEEKFFVYMNEVETQEGTEHQSDAEFTEAVEFIENNIEYEIIDAVEEQLESECKLTNNVKQEDNVLYPEGQTHTLCLRRRKETGDYFHCTQCQLDYESIEEFSRCHMQDETLVVHEEENSETSLEVWDIASAIEDVKPYIQKGSRDSNLEMFAADVQEFVNDTAEEEVYQELNDNCGDESLQSVIKQEILFDTSDDSGDKFFCCYCQKVFSSLQTAEEHICSANTSQDLELTKETPLQTLYECSFCQTTLKTFGGLQRHQLNCRMKPPSMQLTSSEFKCEVCLKIFPNAKSLHTHKRVHETPESKHLAEKVVCEICNTKFSSSKNLKLHMKIHNKKPIKSIQEALPAGAEVQYNELNQFFCEICNKKFDQNLLAVHKNMHQNVEEFNCSVCNKQFENLPSYEMHMQLHAEKPQERRGQTKAERNGTRLPFPCNYCGREFARPHEKVKHERIHTGEKPYECEVCGKTFRVSYSLTMHLRTHTDIRPYVCATCNKRFKSQPVYAHHLNTHLAERPYKCNLCPKSFRTSVQLCGHKNSHKKPFNCTECNRPFATLYAVKIHMKTHSKTNKSNDNLKHRCTVCGAVYARVFALRYHMKEQHSMELGTNGTDLDMNNTDASDNAISSVTLNDEDAAVLIAAAAGASANSNVDNEEKFSRIHRNEELCLDDNTILETEEINVDNFHTEEIVTDWLEK